MEKIRIEFNFTCTLCGQDIEQNNINTMFHAPRKCSTETYSGVMHCSSNTRWILFWNQDVHILAWRVINIVLVLILCCPCSIHLIQVQFVGHDVECFIFIAMHIIYYYCFDYNSNKKMCSCIIATSLWPGH